ncbi:MAG: glutamate--cysteine ligase [Microlunatus sp.]|nr:glutamate--cysteine ligase [Microlunatus sp.]MDN5803531.1 glutamate--cysteine ligase [Microlunatus sp.]
MRTIGVEEELLLVDPETGRPVAIAGSVLDRVRSSGSEETEDDEGAVEGELQQQQIEIGTPPCRSLDELGSQVRRWRHEAIGHAERAGARIVAVGTSPLAVVPTLTIKPRYQAMVANFGLTAAEQLSCGCHVHIGVSSEEEGVAVLDRIRVWLPALLALSTNSPYWQGTDTGYASFRSQTWARLPTAGPTEIFGSADRYHNYVETLLDTKVVLDEGMVYFHARLSHHLPTVEIRITDVCLEADDSVLIAALTRGLVETAARNWHAGAPPPPTDATLLRLATWRAGRSGLGDQLLDPVRATPSPAKKVIANLVEHVADALRDAGDDTIVAELLAALFSRGTGASRQRAWTEESSDLGAMVLRMADVTNP